MSHSDVPMQRQKALPIETAPRDGTYVILLGPSGYMDTPHRAEVCKFDQDYRPLQPWITYSGDSYLDGGGMPTHWIQLPEFD